MHGKIVRYISSNGKGVVITASKVLFEFTHLTWHDRKKLPMVGMFVEFRCDENNNITECKASKFQEFGGNVLVSEKNFWRSETDKQLEELQSTLRDEMIQKIYKSTDYTHIKAIPLTISVTDAIKDYFQDEFLAITFANDLHVSPEAMIYDFRVVERFISKALDSLLFNDKSVRKDDFMEEMNVMTRLKSAYAGFESCPSLNIERIFKQYFLMQQYHFQAFKVALENLQDKIRFCEKRTQSCKNELLIIERRIQNKIDYNQSLAKKERFENELKKLLKDSVEFNKQSCFLNDLKKQFEEYYFGNFRVYFDKIYQNVQKKIKSGLDLCVTILDDKIYQKITHSMAFEKSYFTHMENDKSPVLFCYVDQYLKHLNKERLNPNDSVLYAYFKKVKRKYCKYFLIVSSNKEESTRLKLEILAQNKFYSVKIADKQILYFSLIQEYKFETIYIDSNSVWKDAQELIAEGKALRTNRQSEYNVFSLKNRANRFGFQE